MKMTDINIGSDYRVNWIRMQTVTVLEKGLHRGVTPSNPPDGVQVRLHGPVKTDVVPGIDFQEGDEVTISQRCFLKEEAI